MKKTALFVGLAAFMGLALMSCKKDYTCTCEYDDGSGTSTYMFDYSKQKKADAEEACDTQETQIKTIDSNGSCTLSSK